MKVYGITGWKNSGKTTLVERLVTEITARGISVSTVKHAHHAFDIDHPGKDSFRHRTAGARQVLVASAARWALMSELRAAPEPTLDALLAQLAPVDLVLVEGYKRDRHPKLEVRRTATAQDLIAAGDATIEAVASDAPLPGLKVPVLDLDDVPAIADFILIRTGLKSGQSLPASPRAHTCLFDTHVMVDWSARSTPSPRRETRDALWACVARGGATEPPRYFRTRTALLAWLADVLATESTAGRRTLAGFDFPFGYPAGFAARLTGSPRALDLWAHIADRITDTPDNAHNLYAVAASINRSLGGGPFWGRPRSIPQADVPEKKSDRRTTGLPEFRAVEAIARGAKSCWQLAYAGAVGAQALTGIAALERLRRDPRLPDITVWPFETGFTAPDAPVTLAEIYPSLLNAAVARAMTPDTIKDAEQVRLTALAFARLDRRGALAPLFSPPLASAIAACEEGWILGADQAAALVHAVD